MSIHGGLYDCCAPACTGVGVSLAEFRELQVTLCSTLHEGLTCLIRCPTAATFSDASGKAFSLLQTRQMLRRLPATLLASPS